MFEYKLTLFSPILNFLSVHFQICISEKETQISLLH